MRLGVFGRADDPSVQHVIERAHARGHEARAIDLAAMNAGARVRMTLEEDGARWLVETCCNSRRKPGSCYHVPKFGTFRV